MKKIAIIVMCSARPPLIFTLVAMLLFAGGLEAQPKTIEIELSKLPNASSPQEKIPILTSLAVAYIYRNPDSSIFYAGNLIRVSKEIRNATGEADGYRIQGMALVAQNKNRDALVPLMAAKRILDTLGSAKKTASNDAMIAQALSSLKRYEESNKILEGALEILRKENSMEGVALMLSALSNNARYQKRMLAAIELGEEAYHLLDSMGIRQNLSRISNNLSFCYEYIGNYDKAISVLLEDLADLEKANMYGEILQTKTRLVFLYVQDNQLAKGKREGNDAIKIAKDLGREDYAADIQVHLANMYSKLGETDPRYLDSAITLLESSEAIYLRLSQGENSFTSKGNVYITMHELGTVYRDKQEYGKAHLLAKESMSFFVQEADTPFICKSLQLQGNIFIRESRFDSALAAFKRMEGFVIKSSQPLNMSYCDALEGQAEAYKGLGEIDEAYAVAKRLLNVRDSLEDSGAELEKVGLQEKYENEHRDRERLEKITELKIESDERRRKLQMALLAGIFVSVICLVLVLLYRKIRKQNLRLAELHDSLESKNRSLAQSEQLVMTLNLELYHYVNNVIRRAWAYSVSALKFVETEHDKTIVSELAQRCLALADIHRTLLDLRTSGKVDMAEFVHAFASKMIEELWEEGVRPTAQYELESLMLNNTHAQAIGLLLEEFLANSFKHGSADQVNSEIRIALHAKDGQVWFIFEDGGPGIKKANLKGDTKGFGLHFVRTTVEKDLRGKVDWANGNSRIVINFPYEKA